MLVKLPVTASPVLAGEDAGVTVTVSSRLPAGSTDAGEAVPTPEGRAGLPPQTFAGALLLRGMGPMTTKSFELLSVSMQPLPLRTPAVVLLSAAMGVVSKQLGVPAPPYPNMSAIPFPVGHSPESTVVLATSAIFPEVAPILMAPVISAAGRGVVPPAPCGLLHQIVVAGLQDAGAIGGAEIGDVPGCDRRGSGLDGPQADIHRRGGLVIDLDEVVGVGGSRITAAAVDLADLDAVRRGWRLHGERNRRVCRCAPGHR